MGGGSSAWGRNTAAYDRQVDDIVILHAGATLSAPALILRPWCVEDIAALVDVFRDPALRRWTSSAVENEGDAMRWVRDQERGWAAGNRFGFAVLEAQPESSRGQLVGHMVRKEVASGKPSAEVGYWTAAHARGRRVAPRALETVTRWAFDVLGGATRWSVWNSCTRSTTRPRAAWRTRAGTASTQSCPRRRPLSPARVICTSGAGMPEISSVRMLRRREPRGVRQGGPSRSGPRRGPGRRGGALGQCDQLLGAVLAHPISTRTQECDWPRRTLGCTPSAHT